jgi:hypothetical protein
MTCNNGISGDHRRFWLCPECKGEGCKTTTDREWALDKALIAKLTAEKDILIAAVRWLGGEWDGRAVTKRIENGQESES